MNFKGSPTATARSGTRPNRDSRPITTRTPEGNADWDLIGLRKTRCALWCAYLASPLAAHVAAQTIDTNEIYNVGRVLVELAEFDTFTRDQPNAGEDPSIPFG